MKKPEKARMNIYVTKDLKESISKKSTEMGLDMSAFITIAVNEYLKQEEAVNFIELFKQLKKDGKV